MTTPITPTTPHKQHTDNRELHQRPSKEAMYVVLSQQDMELGMPRGHVAGTKQNIHSIHRSHRCPDPARQWLLGTVCLLPRVSWFLPARCREQTILFLPSSASQPLVVYHQRHCPDAHIFSLTPAPSTIHNAVTDSSEPSVVELRRVFQRACQRPAERGSVVR